MFRLLKVLWLQTYSLNHTNMSSRDVAQLVMYYRKLFFFNSKQTAGKQINIKFKSNCKNLHWFKCITTHRYCLRAMGNCWSIARLMEFVNRMRNCFAIDTSGKRSSIVDLTTVAPNCNKNRTIAIFRSIILIFGWNIFQSFSTKLYLRWIGVAVAIRWIRVHTSCWVIWIVRCIVEACNVSCWCSIVCSLHSSATTEVTILEHLLVMSICFALQRRHL